MNGSATNYGYDAANQLTTDGPNNYSYDPNGNRNMAGYATGTGNRITTDGTWTYVHDAEGNIVKKTQGVNAETWTFGYDHRNQMIWAEKRATDGGTLQMRADYEYDVFGNRVEKRVDPDGVGGQGTTTTKFAHEMWQTGRGWPKGNENWDVWAELDGSNNLKRRFVHGDAVDQLFARIDAQGNAAWYLTDRMGSVRDIVNASGSVIDHIDYTGTGKVISETSPGNGDDWGWTGRLFNDETGLQDNRARQYDPEIGRFWGEDPWRMAAGDGNYFRYARNNPQGASDPSGMDIYYLLDTEYRVLGVKGEKAHVGHAATLIGPDKKGRYKFFSWGPGRNWWSTRDDNLTQKEFKSLKEAINDPIIRDRYGKYIKFDATKAQDQKAIDYIVTQYTKKDFAPLTHNCTEMVAYAIQEAFVDKTKFQDERIPLKAFEANKAKGEEWGELEYFILKKACKALDVEHIFDKKRENKLDPHKDD